jgi:hypothetical protein
MEQYVIGRGARYELVSPSYSRRVCGDKESDNLLIKKLLDIREIT